MYSKQWAIQTDVRESAHRGQLQLKSLSTVCGCSLVILTATRPCCPLADLHIYTTSQHRSRHEPDHCGLLSMHFLFCLSAFASTIVQISYCIYCFVWSSRPYNLAGNVHNVKEKKKSEEELQLMISHYCQNLWYCISLVSHVWHSDMTQLSSRLSSFRENLGETCFFPTGRVEPERPAATLTKRLSTNKSQESLKGEPTSIHAAQSSSSSAMQQANAMLQDLSRLKDEMRNLIQVNVVNE